MAKEAKKKTKPRGMVYRKEEQLDLFAHLALDTANLDTAPSQSHTPPMCGDRWLATGSPWLLEFATAATHAPRADSRITGSGDGDQEKSAGQTKPEKTDIPSATSA